MSELHWGDIPTPEEMGEIIHFRQQIASQEDHDEYLAQMGDQGVIGMADAYL